MLSMDAAWHEWVNTNVDRGCTVQSMVDAMIKNGFDADTADAEVQKAFDSHRNRSTVPDEGVVEVPNDGGAVAAKATVEVPAGGYHYDEVPVASGNVIHAHDREVKVLMRVEKPQVIVFGDVLSDDESNELIERSRHRLKRSGTVNEETGEADIIPARTSEGTWFKPCEDEFIERIDKRIASLMNWPLENGEGLQVLHYNVGGEYRAHFDYFAPDQKGSAAHLVRGGQRVSTLVVYLNDVPQGGETTFPSAGISVAAKRGSAVYFRYMNGFGQLDRLSLHAGAPVITGDKWVMTKWMRERKYRK